MHNRGALRAPACRCKARSREDIAGLGPWLHNLRSGPLASSSGKAVSISSKAMFTGASKDLNGWVAVTIPDQAFAFRVLAAPERRRPGDHELTVATAPPGSSTASANIHTVRLASRRFSPAPLR